MFLFFGFGVYSRYREWFMKEDVPGNPIPWISISLSLTILYFIIGQDLFENIDISNSLSPLYLLSFSLVRSFLLLAYLMMSLSIAIRYFKQRNPFLNRIADVSYEIYLVHMFVVGGFQMLFAGYTSIPIGVKIGAVFMIATLISYFFGKYTLKKFPKMSGSVLFVLFFVLMVIYNR